MNPSRPLLCRRTAVVCVLAGWMAWLGALSAVRAAPGPRVEVVADFSNWQVTGVAVSSRGRVFVNFPDWSDPHGLSVAELGRDGRLVSFPNATWNATEGPAENRFVCVQSV